MRSAIESLGLMVATLDYIRPGARALRSARPARAEFPNTRIFKQIPMPHDRNAKRRSRGSEYPTLGGRTRREFSDKKSKIR
jgi:hypothetical protein